MREGLEGTARGIKKTATMGFSLKYWRWWREWSSRGSLRYHYIWMHDLRPEAGGKVCKAATSFKTVRIS